MGFVRQSAFVAAVLALAIVDLPAVGDWITLDGCQLVPSPGNDGDSFHVSADGKEYIFRLYLVDVPETDAENPARLIEQAKHFGITVPQVLKSERRQKRSPEKTARTVHRDHSHGKCDGPQ
jgi:hypothetical protein